MIPGPRAIDLTRDIGIAGVPFDGALRGDIGPFLRAVPTPGVILTPGGRRRRVLQVTTSTAFIGDPNVPTQFTGSPTGFNKVRGR